MGLKLESLALLRKEKKLSQNDLAQIFDVAQNTISQWETGEREPDNATLVRLAEYFDVSTDYLLGKTSVRAPVETVAAHRINIDEEMTPDEEEELTKYLKFMRAQNAINRQQAR